MFIPAIDKFSGNRMFKRVFIWEHRYKKEESVGDRFRERCYNAGRVGVICIVSLDDNALIKGIWFTRAANLVVRSLSKTLRMLMFCFVPNANSQFKCSRKWIWIRYVWIRVHFIPTLKQGYMCGCICIHLLQLM